MYLVKAIIAFIIYLLQSLLQLASSIAVRTRLRIAQRRISSTSLLLWARQPAYARPLYRKYHSDERSAVRLEHDDGYFAGDWHAMRVVLKVLRVLERHKHDSGRAISNR